MDVNVLVQRCRVLRTASPDVVTGLGSKPVDWEEFGYTAGNIITFRQLGEGSPQTKYGIGHFTAAAGAERGGSAFILHGEAEVLKV
jgi:hypothetical protein